MQSRWTMLTCAVAAVMLLFAAVPADSIAFRAPDEPQNMSGRERGMQQPLRLKTVVQRDLKRSINGDPVQAALQLTEKIMNQGTNQFSASGPSVGAAPEMGAKISRASLRKEQTDELGFQHIRVAQKYKGLPVVGAELIVHINDSGVVYMINGSYQPDTGILTVPTVVAEDALNIGLDEHHGKENMHVAEEPSLVIYGSHLAWYYVIEYDGTEPGQWRYYVDAQKGFLVNSYNNIQYAAPVEVNGAPAAVSGYRLAGEDGTSVSMQGFYESGDSGNYFLYSFANLWGIYDYAHGVNSPGAGADWIQEVASNWGTSDPAAISCAKNFEDTQDYVSTVLGRNSFDNSGAFAQASVHVDTNYVNAYWDGSSFNFGDGDGSKANALTILDVAAHEYGHAITQYTSDLIYQNESGALNEAYSDIFGSTVEFAKQADGTAPYPNSNAGQADWLIAEDCWLPAGTSAMRDMQDPQRLGHPSYYHGTNWYFGPLDNGGVHTNSGVANFAYYLLAEGGTGNNDGTPYSITGIGEPQAAAVALRANYHYHTPGARYADARTFWIQAAQDLGYSTQTVADVWSACGVDEPVVCGITYSHDDTVTYNFDDISTTGTALGQADDDYDYISIPFNFTFYCGAYDHVSIASNGTVYFDDAYLGLSNTCIPGTDGYGIDSFIAVLWDNLNPASGGDVFYEIKGTSPNRRLIVQWNDVPRFSNIGDATFQAILYEGSNNILLQYADVDFGDVSYDGGASATVGVQKNSTVGTQYSCNTATLSDGLAILFTPSGLSLSPGTLEVAGCADEPLKKTYSLFNSLGSEKTFSLTYDVTTINGAFYGPSSLTVADGATGTFEVTLSPYDTTLVGEVVKGTITAVSGSEKVNAYITVTVGDGWAAIAEEPDNGRMDNVVAAYSGKLWSITGYGDTADVRNYNPETNTWAVVAGSAPSFGINYARSGCQVGNTVYVYGDTTTSGFTGLWSYNMDSNAWISLSPGGTGPATTGIWAPAWVYDPDDNLCYLTGGATTPGGGNLASVHVYDPAADSWQTALPNFTTPRDFHAAWIVGQGTGKKLCIAGGGEVVDGSLDSTQCYGFTGSSWNSENSDVGALPATWWGMGYAETVVACGSDELLWLVAGQRDDSATAVTAYYNVKEGAWFNTGSLATDAVYRTSAVSLDGELYKLGGDTGGFTYSGQADMFMRCPCKFPWLIYYPAMIGGTE